MESLSPSPAPDMNRHAATIARAIRDAHAQALPSIGPSLGGAEPHLTAGVLVGGDDSSLEVLDYLHAAVHRANEVEVPLLALRFGDLACRQRDEHVAVIA